MIGFLLVDKPSGWTSHDAVAKVRRVLGEKRVGHAGTLDPMCTGLLLMAVGHATRFMRYLNLEPKEYVGEMTLGVETATHDSEGEPIETRDASHVTIEALRSAAARLTGRIAQVPPMFSAVKIGGQRLYKLARKGEEVERPSREIEVFAFDILGLSDGRASFRVSCSGGTYVRTLAHDLGRIAGCGAHLSSLRRISLGGFHVSQACAPDEVAPEKLLPLDGALDLPSVRLAQGQATPAKHGQKFSLNVHEGAERIALLDEQGRFFAVARRERNEWLPECVLPIEVTSG